MSREYNMRIPCPSPIGRKEPLSHPVNCKNECPYGYDKAFCFPCMLKIEREMKAKKKAKESEYNHGI